MEDRDFAAAAGALKAADALLITAGAGLGVDSGFPDFRGGSGFWGAYPPYAKLGIEFEQLACPRTLNNDAELFWGFYEHRRVLYRDTPPHDGYEILRKWAETRPTFVFTSNVDGHFLRSGFGDEQIVECHGSIHHRQCAEPCCSEIRPAEEGGKADDMASMRAQGAFPRCRRCKGLARPNVLMFGDGGWVADRTIAQLNRYKSWLRSVRRAKLVVLELGAGAALATVRREGEDVAQGCQGTLIRVNPRESAVAQPGDISLPGTALATLRSLSLILDCESPPKRG